MAFPWSEFSSEWTYKMEDAKEPESPPSWTPDFSGDKPIHIPSVKDGNGAEWFRVKTLGEILGYANPFQAAKIYVSPENTLRVGATRMMYVNREGARQMIRRCTRYVLRSVLAFFDVSPRDLRITIEEMCFKQLETALPEVEIDRQYGFGKYKVDGYIHEHKIAIECDEKSHRHKAAFDQKRQKYLERRHGLRFVRFQPEDINSICRAIRQIQGYISQDRRSQKSRTKNLINS